MEDIFFFFLVFLSLLNIDIKGVNQFHYDYMDLKNTSSIRGVFVWMIFLKHYYTYSKKRKYLYIKILRYLAQKIVSLFLFYSGYGIFESIKTKDTNYVKSLPKKAIILFVKFQIIIFFFFLCNIILGIKITIRRYLLSMIFISEIGNSNWFAFTIITFYLYFLVNLLTFNYFYKKKYYSIDNSFCFILGFYYSKIRSITDRLLMKDDSYYFPILSTIIIVYYSFYKNTFVCIMNILMIHCFFCIIVTFITMKIRLNNEFLIFLNSHSFSIYLLQRIIMMFVCYKKYFENNEFMRLFFEFIAIISLSCIFDKFCKIEKLFFKQKKFNKIVIE